MRSDEAQNGNGVASDTSPSTRLQRLVQGMESRERKLARLGAPSNLGIRTTDEQQYAAQVPAIDGSQDARDDDFDIIFNEVKDIYEKELFESRQQRASGAAAWASNGEAMSVSPHDLRFSGHGDSGAPVGPPLSPQDLSVREAIEKEMAELLQDDAFQQLLH